MATGMLIDGVATSNALDSSAERIDIASMDISKLEEGDGVFNYEHRDADASSASPADIVGRIIFAKKIFSEDDCENSRQKDYWKKVEMPFVYIIGRLFDGAGHAAASDIAAMIRDSVANDEPIIMRYSIHGSTLDPDKHGNLRSTIARQVAITLSPCNRTCESGLLEDPNAPDGFEKKPYAKTRDLLESIVEKSELSLLQEVATSPDIPYTPLTEDSLTKTEVLAPLNPFRADFLSIEMIGLAKALQEQMIQKPQPMVFGGKMIIPGEAVLRNGRKMAILSMEGAVVVVPFEKVATYDTSDLKKLPSDQEGDAFTIQTQPVDLCRRLPQAKDVAVNLSTPDHASLLEGLDFGNPGGPAGHPDDSGHWLQKHNGDFVHILKGIHDPQSRSALFAAMAHDFFGLGHCCPATATITPPGESGAHLVQQAVPGIQLPERHPDLATTYEKFNSSGDFDKVAIMDLVLGCDRHPFQYGVGDQGVQLLSNHNAFQWNSPSEFHVHGPFVEPSERLPHPAALSWLKTLDPESLSTKMCLRPTSVDWARNAQCALQAIKVLASTKQALGAPLSFADLVKAAQIGIRSAQGSLHAATI